MPCSIVYVNGRGPQSLLLSNCRQGLLNIPLLYLMSYLGGLYGIVWTQLIADTRLSPSRSRSIRVLKKELGKGVL